MTAVSRFTRAEPDEHSSLEAPPTGYTFIAFRAHKIASEPPRGVVVALHSAAPPVGVGAVEQADAADEDRVGRVARPSQLIRGVIRTTRRMSTYPRLTRGLFAQLQTVPASRDGDLEYRPCAVTLDDGQEHLAVYVVPYAPYIRHWGVRPEDDPGKHHVPVSRVHSIRESPMRLPAPLATELYVAGESGMGYTLFAVDFKDGSTRAYVTGNAVDFIEPPPGCRAQDAVRVLPHRGRDRAHHMTIKYAWCIYEGIEAG